VSCLTVVILSSQCTQVSYRSDRSLLHILMTALMSTAGWEGVAASQSGLRDFPQGTIAEGAPVVPISAQLKYNIDAVCEYIVKKIPVPVR
jgi:hypothetical protein